VKVITGAPDISFIVILTAFLIGWYISRYHHKKRLDDIDERLKLRNDQVAHLKVENEKMESKNEKLQSQVDIRDSAQSSGIFEIEQTEYNVKWRGHGERELRPIHPNMPAPEDATLVLQTMVRITSVPARVVEDVHLSIAGNRLHLSPDQWSPYLVDKCERYFYFEIPSYIEPAYHKVRLIAEYEGGLEKKSKVFRVPLARTYVKK
jgi:hypothetical protein